MVDPLAALYGRDDSKAQRYAGQLDPAFQEQLQAAHADVTPEECNFYHTLDLGDGEVVPGAWDMRGFENSYLGHVAFDGMKVLEFGPASGYLTMWMEAQGALPTILDSPPGGAQDLLPLPGIDIDANARSGAETARQVRNSWWYVHRKRESSALAVYGDIYDLPPDLGRYDICTFSSILLHLSNPFLAMRQGARFTDKAMIITEPLPPVLYGDDDTSLMEFNPGNEPTNLVNWWCLSPGAATKMLKILGFLHVDIRFFEIAYHPQHDLSAEPVSRFMFTAVGQREPGAVSRVDETDAEMEADRRLREIVPVINVDRYNEAHRKLQASCGRVEQLDRELRETHVRLQDADAQLGRIYRSLAWKLTKPLRMLTGNRASRSEPNP